MLLPATAITIADVGDGEGCPSDAVRAREALLRRGFANLTATATATATTDISKLTYLHLRLVDKR